MPTDNSATANSDLIAAVQRLRLLDPLLTAKAIHEATAAVVTASREVLAAATAGWDATGAIATGASITSTSKE